MFVGAADKEAVPGVRRPAGALAKAVPGHRTPGTRTNPATHLCNYLVLAFVFALALLLFAFTFAFVFAATLSLFCTPLTPSMDLADLVSLSHLGLTCDSAGKRDDAVVDVNIDR